MIPPWFRPTSSNISLPEDWVVVCGGRVETAAWSGRVAQTRSSTTANSSKATKPLESTRTMDLNRTWNNYNFNNILQKLSVYLLDLV